MSTGRTIIILPDLRAKVPWIDFPLVQAPSAEDRNKSAFYEISDEFIIRHFNNRRRVPIFQGWVHLAGRLPPIPNINSSMHRANVARMLSVQNASACFRGVKRPQGDEPFGSSILVYVVNSALTITYQSDAHCAARAAPSPTDTVLAVHVSPGKQVVNYQDSSHMIDGVIIHWEFVRSDNTDRDLPRDYSTRYSKQLW